ncbi:MAG: hypothetical protein ACREQY_08905 [Candidatus Binatia bacterium]
MGRHLRIWLDDEDPPVGRLELVGDDGTRSTAPVAFVGWLDLLRVMGEMLSPPPGPAAPG